MKLKKLLLIGVVLLPMLACDEPDTSYLTETNLVIDIPITAHLSTFNENANPAIENYDFNGIGIFCLRYSNELKGCPGDIMQIIPGTGSTLSFEWLKSSETIKKLQLNISYKTQGESLYAKIKTVDLLQAGSSLHNTNKSVNLDDILAPLINRLNENPRYYISIQVNGTANFNINKNAEVSIPMLIETEYHAPRFTL
ncbi:hypothetical protein [uncultured Draconibacterium sp.]|uniref:hypothetical protein n=1 Tax=uncultured Draconibacterium sp. TaxID=1573823 RepID=UPI0025CC2D70|nr:hypothetical protein [uncultured Draconibacterium sp.]